MRVYDSNNNLVYKKDNLITKTYSYTQTYEIKSIQDSKSTKGLDINLSINSLISSMENVSVILKYENNFLSKTSEIEFSKGENEITLTLDRQDIANTNYDGKYEISGIFIGQKYIPIEQNTSSYEYEDFTDKPYIKSIDFELLDINNNNLTDYIEVKVKIENSNEEIPEIKVDLYDANENLITSKAKKSTTIKIDGSLLYSLKAISPYTIGVSLFSNQTLLNYKEILTEEQISYLNFERPSFPDLQLKMKSKFNGLSVVEVKVKNKGDATAFNINLEIFDGNNFTKKFNIDSLKQRKEKEIEFIINEPVQGELTAIIDFENFIEEKNESNNIARINVTNSYPAFEICDVDMDFIGTKASGRNFLHYLDKEKRKCLSHEFMKINSGKSFLNDFYD